MEEDSVTNSSAKTLIEYIKTTTLPHPFASALLSMYIAAEKYICRLQRAQHLPCRDWTTLHQSKEEQVQGHHSM